MENENITLSDMDIQWHPAFCAAAELEFKGNKTELDFQREYNLSKKPLQIDLLVVEKLDDVNVENEIGRIFRKYNVIEYKSPKDGLTIDDFFKTFAYAELYKSQGKTVDQIPINQLTVSVVREGKPEELFRSLVKYGFTVEEKFKGIYYVYGLHLPAQIVVTKELDRKKHRSLRVLSEDALEEDVRAFIEDARKLTAQGDLINVDAILQVSVSANYNLYNELKRRYPEMCEAMKTLMRDEMMEAQREGEMKKARETALKMKKKGYSDTTIADILEVGVTTVQQWFSEKTSVAR
ncbi:hypothetical protein [Marvinbryantia formatexigens]|nr:hypothetical protein [Marvinbryantia formatexigens]UWO25165.1 hypothetical protein NQ534_01335 [Marvinbryantia formatexigens DSM 14469]SDH09113.1 hypothetical protein SAMN05660368_03824 [Marvinbryantia formatexigens]